MPTAAAVWGCRLCPDATAPVNATSLTGSRDLVNYILRAMLAFAAVMPAILWPGCTLDALFQPIKRGYENWSKMPQS